MRKKLFAVIMSAMMMITFMPSMAFAAGESHNESTHNEYYVDNIKFVQSDSYKTITGELKCKEDIGSGVQCGFSYGTISATTSRTFAANTGVITASGDSALEAAALQALTNYGVTAGSLSVTLIGYTALEYYDLTGATITNNGTAVLSVPADNYLDSIVKNPLDSKLYFAANKCVLGTHVTVVEPADLVASGATAKKGNIALTRYQDSNSGEVYYTDNSTFANSKFRVDITPAAYEAYEDTKDVEIPVEFSVYADKNVINAGKGTQKISINSDYVTMKNVQFTAKGKGTTGFKLDNYGTNAAAAPNNDVPASYVGEDQAFALASKGVSVEYGTYDKLNNLTWSATAPAMKDVKADGTYKFLVKLTRKNVVKYAKVSFDINPAGLVLGFKSDEFVFAQGEKVATKDIVEVKTAPVEISAGSGIYRTSAIYSADKKTAEAFVNKFVTLEGVRTTVGKNKIYLTKKNVQTTAAKNDPEFYQFALNYYATVPATDNNFKLLTAGGKEVDMAEATLQVVKGENYFKTNKKSIKIKRGKSATLKDTARFGTVTFKKISGNSKIKVASNGKITVKKSLAKKTYKVKITERVNGTSQSLALKRTKTIKVIVK